MAPRLTLLTASDLRLRSQEIYRNLASGTVRIGLVRYAKVVAELVRPDAATVEAVQKLLAENPGQWPNSEADGTPQPFHIITALNLKLLAPMIYGSLKVKGVPFVVLNYGTPVALINPASPDTVLEAESMMRSDPALFAQLGGMRMVPVHERMLQTQNQEEVK